MYLAYGVVAVLKGRHKGRLGYYDNDSDMGKSAIVYLDGAPVGPDYVLIFKKWLRDATQTEKRQWETQHLNQLAYYRAVRKLGDDS